MELPIQQPNSIQTLRGTVPDMENAKQAIDSAFVIIQGVMASIDKNFLERDPTIVLSKIDFGYIGGFGKQIANDLNNTLVPKRKQLFDNLNNFTAAANDIVNKFDNKTCPVEKLELDAQTLYMSGMSIWGEFQEWLNMFNMLVIASANNILTHLSTCRTEGQPPYQLHKMFEV